MTNSGKRFDLLVRQKQDLQFLLKHMFWLKPLDFISYSICRALISLSKSLKLKSAELKFWQVFFPRPSAFSAF